MTMTQEVFNTVKKNAKRGLTVQQITFKLSQKFPFTFISRQTVSGRVTELARKGKLVGSSTRKNTETGKLATVYTTPNAALKAAKPVVAASTPKALDTGCGGY